jgi:hypothetical protein
MALTFEERLNQILPKIASDDFLNSKGLGNEIGFWIFDYPPDREMDMRDFLARTVLPSLNKAQSPIRLRPSIYLTWLSSYLKSVNCSTKLLKCSETKAMNQS